MLQRLGNQQINNKIFLKLLNMICLAINYKKKSKYSEEHKERINLYIDYNRCRNDNMGAMWFFKPFLFV